MLDVMLDLETMGNNPSAAIVAIGAVEFDVSSGNIGEKFYSVIDLEASVICGGVIDASTVLWWMKQSDEARSLFNKPGVHISQVLAEFEEWMKLRGPKEEIRVWGNASTFDNIILVTAYKRLGKNPPWTYKGDRCYRTIKNLYPDIKIQRSGTHHHALDDAESQARHLIAMLTRK